MIVCSGQPVSLSSLSPLALVIPTMSQVSIITGAGSGIGRATAELLAAQGHHLCLVGRRLEQLEQTAAACSGKPLCIDADIAAPAAAERVVASSIERFGRVDNLINNAGFAPLAEIDQSSPQLLEQVYQVNALGPARLIAACWPRFAKQKSGRVVNVSTLGTADPFPGFFAYAAAKCAVNSMARSCAIEGRTIGVKAFAVAPGAVETEMLRANFPPSRLPPTACLSPNAVAQVIVDCLTGKHDDRNGQTLFMTAQRGVW